MTQKACPECGKEVDHTNLGRHRVRVHGIKATPPGRPRIVDVDDTPDADDFTDSPYSPDEKSPAGKVAPGKPGRLRGMLDRGTKTRHRRVSVADLFETAWTQAASTMIRVDPPVGRVLAFQAPVAGDLMEDAIAGTPFDRLIQPAARMHGQSAAISALVGVPITVAMIERFPDRRAVLVPALRAQIGPMLVALAKGAKKAEKRRAEKISAIEELGDFLPPELLAEMRSRGLTPEDALIELIFAPTPETASQETEP